MQKNQKPSKNLRIEYHTDYSGDNVFASKARLLQSMWRDEKGYEYGKYGNYLKLDFAKESGANFLTKEIKQIVRNEVANKSRERKVIQEPRIWNNLLSSQPLAFNLFGELKLNLEQTSKIFKELFPERKVKKVTAIKFEYSPGRRNQKYTGDSSAFDIFVVYENSQNQIGFFGIEVKYSENLNDKPSSHKERYEEISEKTKIFDLSKIDELKSKPIQQIWRDHLLALSLSKINDDFEIGDFIYLYPSENINCQKGIGKYKSTFNENIESYFNPLTIEKFVASVKNHCEDNWITEFEDRYLNFSKIIEKEKKASR